MSARSHKIRVGQVEIYAEDTGQTAGVDILLRRRGQDRRALGCSPVSASRV